MQIKQINKYVSEVFLDCYWLKFKTSTVCAFRSRWKKVEAHVQRVLSKTALREPETQKQDKTDV